MDELQQKEEYLFEENEENIVIKYKLLRSLIIKHYHRGCKYLEITKIVCAIFFLIFTAVGIIVCSNGGSKAFYYVDNHYICSCKYLFDNGLLQISC